jgi:hypothetical protein
MPGKSKKGKGPPPDDFDDIIADAQHVNATVTTPRTNHIATTVKTPGSRIVEVT